MPPRLVHEKAFIHEPLPLEEASNAQIVSKVTRRHFPDILTR
jgi:hypothetical protein